MLREIGQVIESQLLVVPNREGVGVMIMAFRKRIEEELECPVDKAELNAGLLLWDLCEFLGLDDAQRQRALGYTTAARIEELLGADEVAS